MLVCREREAMKQMKVLSSAYTQNRLQINDGKLNTLRLVFFPTRHTLVGVVHQQFPLDFTTKASIHGKKDLCCRFACRSCSLSLYVNRNEVNTQTRTHKLNYICPHKNKMLLCMDQWNWSDNLIDFTHTHAHTTQAHAIWPDAHVLYYKYYMCKSVVFREISFACELKRKSKYKVHASRVRERKVTKWTKQMVSKHFCQHF